jgi:tripartite-type tricarboxylate transporter receptor subunit TctC
MSESLGQQIVVENIGGAGGGIGAATAARAEPDGYTLFFGSAGIIAVNPLLYKNLGYSVKEFTPISLIATYPSVLFVNPAFPAKDLKELIAYAKANPGRVSFGSAGYGSSGHLWGELLKHTARIDIVHVPYKGGGPAMNDVIGGHLSMMMEAAVVGWSQVKEGKLRALGVTSPSRLSMAPELPTFAEAGLSGFDAGTWYGCLAPARTPEPIIAKLQEAIATAVRSPDIKQRLAEIGMVGVGSTAQEFQNAIQTDTGKWARIIKITGATVE